MREQWVLPRRGRSTLVRRDGAAGDGSPRFVDVGELAMTPGSPWDAEGDTVVFAEAGQVHVARPGVGASEGWSAALPRGVAVHAVRLRDGVAFLGGMSRQVELGSLDTRQRGARWVPLDVPRDRISYHKAIDGFAIDGDRLIAVDDFRLPRYLLVYDVSDPRQPRFLRLRDLPAHGTNERITSVAQNAHALALLSTTMNHGAAALVVSLLPLATLRERTVMRVRSIHSLRRWDDVTLDLRALSLSARSLFLAAGGDGLGHVDLTPWFPERRSRRPLAPADVRYTPVDGGPVVGVEAIDDAHAWAIVEAAGGEQDARLLAL